MQKVESSSLFTRSTTWRFPMRLKMLSFFVLAQVGFAAERFYELRIQNVTKNVTGIDVDFALAINGSIPAPTLKFRLGDTAVINVVNETEEPTTLHWHGVLVPWRQDGPAFYNSRIIEPGSSHTYRFPIEHTGTYWYHSHTQLQEQRGLYGAIVIEEERPKHTVDHDEVFIMSDWIDEHPSDVLNNIKKDGHHYAYKKGFLPSLWGAVQEGKVGEYLDIDWSAMGFMDLSDIGYDAFLINGRQRSNLEGVKPGDKIRFRIINAGASTYFYFNIGAMRNFTVVSKDGVDIQPVQANELLIGMGETYDIIFEMPHHAAAFEARSTAQDVTGHASLVFGTGREESVPDREKPNPYEEMDHGSHGMDHGSHGTDHGSHRMDHGSHGMDQSSTAGIQKHGSNTHRLDYTMIKSVEPTDFEENLIRAQTIDLELSGDMERYNWYINGKPFSEDKYIHIQENEVITFRFINKTMMHHPMHLHGHFFRLLAGNGNFSPLFHTVDVPPMGTVTIEFHADRPGIWFLHCHNLYHMKMGMARLVKYEGIEQTDDLRADEEKWASSMTHDNAWFPRIEAMAFTNKLELGVAAGGGRYEFEAEFETHGYDAHQLEDHSEVEVMLKRLFFGDNVSFGGGAVVEGGESRVAVGFGYRFLRVLNEAELEGYITKDGTVSVELSRPIHLTDRITVQLVPEIIFDDGVEWEFESDVIYNFGPRFGIGLNFSKKPHGAKAVGFGIRAGF